MHSGAAQDALRIAGRYRLLNRLGKGGMGEVYRARDEASGRLVALKCMRPPARETRRRAYEAMFEREYHTLVRLRHARAIEVYDYGRTDDGPYYTMELLDGGDLHKAAPLPFLLVCQHLRDVVSLLALLHAHRMVHRDVTPGNVRLTGDGRAKLIDFGALHGFGVAADLVGTPPCLAPEAYHRMPIDQRTDLYAVGAVAYWALTRKHAYPAREVQDLPDAWANPPPPPSAFAPEVPAELDRLVLSLLALDPLSRPASDAAVIDQLTAIAGLPPESHAAAAESYLQSSRMVGRDVEEGWIDQRVAQAKQGTGADIVIEGAPGIGKTRLLREVCLRAQLQGLTIVSIDAEAARSSFGVAAKIAEQLLIVRPELCTQAAGQHAAVLAHLSDAVRDALPIAAAAGLPLDPAERRARMQAALHGWLFAIARQQALLLAVDNVQAADENSAAFLAALSLQVRDSRLLLLLTQRSGDPLVARSPLRALRAHAARLKLGPLSEASCHELLRSVFGDVANIGRVAMVLHEKSLGNPRLCLDLVQLLVTRQIAKYASGAWVLPQEIADEELPSHAHEIVATRLQGLSAPALALARVLSIHERPLGLPLCLGLASVSHEQTYTSLDELGTAEVVLRDRDQVRFASPALRQALLTGMDADALQQLHLHAAEVLSALAPAERAAKIQCAWHLMQGGQQTRGAELLCSMGRPFMMVGESDDAVQKAVTALSAAVAVFEREGRGPHELASLLLPMLPLAFSSADWRVIARHGRKAIDVGVEITGLRRAAALAAFVGPQRALATGLGAAKKRLNRRKRTSPISYDLPQAITMLCSAVPAAVGTFALWLDIATTRHICAQLAPLAWLGAPLPALAHGFASTRLKILQGRNLEVIEAFEGEKARMHDPSIVALMGQGPARGTYAAMLWTNALLRTEMFGHTALERADELEKLGIAFWALGAAQVRLLYHAFRGDFEQVQRCRDSVELLAVQGGTTWQLEMLLPTWLLNADVLTEDTVGARRTAEQLARRASYVPSLEVYAELAQAAYLLLHGRVKDAIGYYERIVPRLPPREASWWRPARSAFARALNVAGEHARARELLRDALAHNAPGEEALVVESLELERQLALAEAGCGDHAQAVGRLDWLLTRHRRQDNRLLVGLLFKARAEVAIAMRDADTYERNAREAEWRFRGTCNPALIAQCERLGELAIDTGLRPRRAGPASATLPRAAELGGDSQRVLHEIRSQPHPREHALRYILYQAGAEVGHLYACVGPGLRLVASIGGAAPDPHAEALLLQCLERSRADAADDDEDRDGGTRSGLWTEQPALTQQPTRFQPTEPAPADTPSPPQPEATIIIEPSTSIQPEAFHQVRLLKALQHGRQVVVGGLVVQADARGMSRLREPLLHAIADALFESGTIHSAGEVSLVT